MTERQSDKRPRNAAFLDWIGGATIYIGYSRYGLCGGHGFVAASTYDEDEKLRIAIEDLGMAGDMDAFDARDYIESCDCWYANDPDPAIAMQKLMGKMREFQRTIDYKCYELLITRQHIQPTASDPDAEVDAEQK